MASGCTTARGETVDYQSSVGWLHGKCLAIENPNLKQEQIFVIVTLDKPQSQQHGRIQGKATHGEECYALLTDRQQVNEQAGYTFYRVSTDAEWGLAIGVLPSAHNTLLDDDAAQDLEHFSYCSSNEGVHFSLWQGEPNASVHLWTAMSLT